MNYRHFSRFTAGWLVGSYQYQTAAPVAARTQHHSTRWNAEINLDKLAVFFIFSSTSSPPSDRLQTMSGSCFEENFLLSTSTSKHRRKAKWNEKIIKRLRSDPNKYFLHSVGGRDSPIGSLLIDDGVLLLRLFSASSVKKRQQQRARLRFVRSPLTI